MKVTMMDGQMSCTFEAQPYSILFTRVPDKVIVQVLPCNDSEQVSGQILLSFTPDEYERFVKELEIETVDDLVGTLNKEGEVR